LPIVVATIVEHAKLLLLFKYLFSAVAAVNAGRKSCLVPESGQKHANFIGQTRSEEPPKQLFGQWTKATCNYIKPAEFGYTFECSQTQKESGVLEWWSLFCKAASKWGKT